MPNVVIKADQSIERATHCIFCNEQATQNAPLTLRYFAKGSFIATLLSPLIHRRHLIYLLFVACSLGAFAAAVHGLIALRAKVGDSEYETLITLIPVLIPFMYYYFVPKHILNTLGSIPWKVLRTGKLTIQPPVCDPHFAAINLAAPEGPKLRALHIIIVGIFFVCLYTTGAFLYPKDWMDQVAFVGVIFMALVLACMIWMILRYQSRRSRRYLTGFASQDRDEFEVLHCSEAFATQAVNLKRINEKNEPIHVCSNIP